MAIRPVFFPVGSTESLVREVVFEFQWFPGMAPSQKQKSVASLHKVVVERLGNVRILEISSKSANPIGVKLSAFNLQLPLEGRWVSVEVAFQAGKCFERGGPFSDLLTGSSRDAKRDARLRASGRLISFEFVGERWPTEPLTAFYDWLYISAIAANPDLAEALPNYGAFTDIEFNPEKSINCQARSAALYVSLFSRGLLAGALSGKDAYLRLVTEYSSGLSSDRLF